MKQFLEQPTTILGVWGLNIVSFLNNTLPYLQFLSLVLAITLSVFSLAKMYKKSKESEKSEEDTNNDSTV